MGLLLNPIGFRIGHLKSWSDAWYMHRIYYPVFLHNVLLIKTLIYYLMFRFFPKKESKWLYSHCKLYIFQNKIFLNMYIYNNLGNSYWKVRFYEEFFKFKPFINLRLRSYWLKKRLIDKNRIALYWFLMMSMLNICIDILGLEDIESKYSEKTLNKIMDLKRKYTTKVKPFVAYEQIWILQKLLLNVKFFYDKFGSTFLWKFFYKQYKNSLKFKKFNKKTNFLQAKMEQILRVEKVKFEYIFLFYIMSFMDFIIKRYNTKYPKNLFSIRVFRNFLRIHMGWFILRPLFLSFSKYIEIFMLKFNFNIFVNMFLINNFSINAAFVSRFISFSMKKKFDFKDMIIPLKKMLGRVMFFKLKKRSNKYLFSRLNNWKNKLNNKFKLNLEYLYSFVYKLDYLLIWIKLLDLKNKFLFYYRRKKYVHLKNLNKKTYKLFYFNFLKIYGLVLKKYLLFYAKLKRYKINLFIFNFKNIKFILNLINLKYFFLKYIKNFYLFFLNKNFIIKFFNLFNNSFIIINNNKWILEKIKLYYLLLLNKFLKNKIILFIINNSKILLFFKKFKEKFIWLYLFFYVSKIFIRIYYYIKDFKKLSYKRRTFRKKFKYNIFLKFLKRQYISWFYYKNIKKLLKNNFLKNNKFLKNYLKFKNNKIKFLNEWLIWEKKIKKLNLSKKKKIFFLKFLKLNLNNNKFNFIKDKKLNLLFLNFKKFKNKNNMNKKFIINNLNLEYYLKNLKKNVNFLKSKKLNLKKKRWKNKIKINKLILKQIFLKNKKIGLMNYTYFYPIRNYLLFKNYNNLYPFFYNISEYFLFLTQLEEFKTYYDCLKNNLLLNNYFLNNRFNLNPSPLKKKKTKLNIFSKNVPVFLGYKFAFNGRFTRKQRAASLWYIRGANPLSSMDQNVEIGLHTMSLTYGKCSIKVWLYKTLNAPTYFMRFT